MWLISFVADLMKVIIGAFLAAVFLWCFLAVQTWWQSRKLRRLLKVMGTLLSKHLVFIGLPKILFVTLIGKKF